MGWPHTAQFLGDAALLDVIARRLKNEQGVDASDDLDGILRELRRRERLDTRSAVTGAEGFETLWSRSKR